MVSSRRAARLAAIQSLYEMELTGTSADVILNDLARRRDMQGKDKNIEELAPPPPETDMHFCADLVRGVSGNTREIDEVVGRSMAKGRTPERMEAVLRAIVRVETYELGRRRDIDPPVTISEFVKLTERFFSENEPRLVNAMLDRIAHDLRPDDMAKTKANGHDRQG